MIEVNNLSKSYGDKKAVKSVSFTVENGEVLGLLGPNGAGKTTTMNMITGYISISGGWIKVNGCDVLEQPEKTKKMIGYLPEQPPLYTDMTVWEYLSFVYDLKKVKMNLTKKDHINDVMNTVSISDVKNRKIKNLSKGYRQRVGFAQALIGKPEVLILDEPTVGLDPNQIIEIRDVIKRLKKDHTIIFSTHILSEAAEICDRVAIIDKGKIVAYGNLEELYNNMQTGVEISLGVNESINSFKDELGKISSVRSVEAINDTTFLIVAEKNVTEEISNLCYKSGVYVTELKVSTPTLEKMFVKLTKDGGDSNEGNI
ncbi:MAG: ABC transporter ATP-binding protein [Clostridia bacterium]